MKFRQGFVTNSSSSSFIIAGIKKEDTDKKFDDDEIYDANLDEINTDSGIIIGKYIAHWEWDFKEITVDEIVNTISETKSALEDIRLGQCDVRIYCGTQRD